MIFLHNYHMLLFDLHIFISAILIHGLTTYSLLLIVIFILSIFLTLLQSVSFSYVLFSNLSPTIAALICVCVITIDVNLFYFVIFIARLLMIRSLTHVVQPIFAIGSRILQSFSMNSSTTHASVL